MIKNQRIYRCLYSKTKCAPLAFAGAKMADACFRTLLMGARLFSKKSNLRPNKSWLQSICQKPASSSECPALPPANGSIILSVIIPAHNAQSYVQGCIESVQNQKAPWPIQIIVVNDGSTDNTQSILEKIEGIETVILKNGKTAARARNEGFLHATGKYIMFLDADDKLTNNAAADLVACAEKNNADIVQGGWQYMSQDGMPGSTQIYANAVYTEKNRLSCYDLPGTPWGKIYRRELFESIRFPANYAALEDTVVHFGLFRAAKTICSIAPVVYCWRKTSTGITATTQSTAKALLSYWIVEEMLHQNQSWALENGTEFYLCLISQLTNYCYVNIRRLPEQEQRAVFALCCQLYSESVSPAAGVYLRALPRPVKMAEQALKKHKFRLWQLYGRFSRYYR